MNSQVIEAWIAQHQPGGKVKLVEACGYAFSVNLIDKILSNNVAPKARNRTRIAHVLGLPVDFLFPVLIQKKESA